MNNFNLRNSLITRIRIVIFNYKRDECRDAYEEEEFIHYNIHYLQDDIEEILNRLVTSHYIKMFPNDTNNTRLDEKIERIFNSYYEYMEYGNIGLIPYVIDTYHDEENPYVGQNLNIRRVLDYYISHYIIRGFMLEVLNTSNTYLK